MKRRTFALALALCLLLIIGFGTLAYFQSSKSLTNYFAVAGIVDPDDPDATIDPNATISPDALFSLKLDEDDNTSADDTVRTETGNTYTNIMPGDTLKKDPTVYNTGKYDAWVRVKVTVTDAADWTAVCEKHGITDLTKLFNGYVASDWVRYSAEDVRTNNEITYTYYLREKLAEGESATLFKSVTIPATFDVQDMAKLATFQLKITGESIQAVNTGDTAKEAFQKWEA